jgi:FkbM family methyltransferase
MKILRTIIERLSRGKVLKRTIKVSGVSTPLYVSPDAQLKYLKSGREAFDHDLIQIAARFLMEDSTVWDVGANVGVFTFSSATVASKGTIVSIEADIWLASILRKSARLDQYRNSDIRVLPVAMSESDGTAKFIIAARGRASNALECAGGRSQMGGTREEQYVPTLRLDTLLSSMPKPDFIKIDVEGAELMVLKGASKIISEIRPVFYIEVGNNVSAEILSLFSNHNYIAASPGGEVLKERCAPNTFFIPVENTKAQQDAGVNVADAP